MTKDNYYHQNSECRDNGSATVPDRWTGLYNCGKFGGLCSMTKCVKAHNAKEGTNGKNS
jgi:hypothetical protein